MIKSNKEGVISMIYTLEDILKALCNDFSEQNRDRLEEIKNDILQDYKRV